MTYYSTVRVTPFCPPLVYRSEKGLRIQWRKENERRRHNFVPLIMEIMSQLANRNKLLPLLDDGVKKAGVARSKEIARRRAEAAAAGATEKK
jgi:hypothetical protein